MMRQCSKNGCTLPAMQGFRFCAMMKCVTDGSLLMQELHKKKVESEEE